MLRTRCSLPVVGLLVALLASCSSETEKAPPKEVSITSFTSDFASIDEGQEATLSWTTKNASSIKLFDGTTELQLEGAPVAAGTKTVKPQQTTTYRLEATGASGTAEEFVIVTVVPLLAPEITSFTATPDRFGVDGKVTLAWVTRHATSIAIKSNGESVDLSGKSPQEGSVEVTPGSGRTYTLTATGNGTPANQDVVVTLVPKPAVQFSAVADKVNYGDSTTLRWSTEGEVSEVKLFVEGNEEEVLSSALSHNEFATAALTTATTYVLQAKGYGGTTEEKVTLRVVPIIEFFEHAATEDVRAGMEVELHWKILGGDRAEITNDSGTWAHEITEAELASGSVMATVGTAGKFTLVASAGELDSEPSFAQVTITQKPRFTSLRFDPEEGVTAGRGETKTIRLIWKSDGATQPLELQKNEGPVEILQTKTVAGDSIDIEVDGPTDLRLTLRGDNGDYVKVLPVPVTPPALIESFAALPARVPMGGTVDLQWNVEDAIAVELLRDGEAVPGVDEKATSSSVEQTVIASTKFQLKAYNGLGQSVLSEEIEITIGSPQNLTFTASEEVVRPEAPITLAWTNLGGTELKVVEQPSLREVCSELDAALIAAGDCTFNAPEEGGLYTYALDVRNTSGSGTASVDVVVFDGPTVDSFEVSANEVGEGDSVTFSWKVSRGLDNEVPTVVLKDQNGKSYPLWRTDPEDGEKEITLYAPGDFVFTLSSPSGSSAPDSHKTLGVKVIARPVITSFSAAAPGYAAAEGDTVSLGWATQHGEGLEIVALKKPHLDHPREEDGAAVHTTTTDVAAGSYTATPTLEAPDFRLRVWNSIGVVAERDLRVGVDPATVLTFTADSYELWAGQSTTLHWTTARANPDGVELGPLFEEISAPFIDASAEPVSERISNNSNEQTFIGGFSFPFFGQSVTKFRSMNCGAIALRNGTTALATPKCDWFNGKPKAFGDTSSSTNLTNIAPYWSETNSSTLSGVTFYVYQALITDPDTGKRSLVLHWKDWLLNPANYSSSKPDRVRVDYEAVLHEDGTFDYRYGEMYDGDYPGQANGGRASIGYGSHNFTGTTGATVKARSFWYQVNNNTEAVPGGLSYRSFRINPAFVDIGGMVAPDSDGAGKTLTPQATMQVSLIARNAHSEHKKTITVGVYRPVEVSNISTDPLYPTPGEAFAFTWDAVDIKALTIKDGGTTIATITDPGVLAARRYVLVDGLADGDHAITFEAQGFVESTNFTSVNHSLKVAYPFDLLSFTSDVNAVEAGGSATLSWTASGLDGIELVAVPGGVVDTSSITSLEGASISVTPTRSTMYTLTGTSLGRTTSRTLIIHAPTDVALSNSAAILGGDTTISWTPGSGATITLTATPAVSGLPATLPDTGSYTFLPTEPVSLELCHNYGSWSDCTSVSVTQIIPAIDVAVTEVMTNPDGDPDAQWFEVRNFGATDIDLRGYSVGAGANSHEIAGTEPVMLTKMGGYMVFSAKPMTGAYEYGTGIRLENQVVGLYTVGLPLVGFDTTNLPSQTAGKSWELSGDRHVITGVARPNEISVGDPASLHYWCQAAAPSPGATGPTCNPMLGGYYDVELFPAGGFANGAFYDIRTHPDAAELSSLTSYANVAAIPGGVPFAFPFFGQQMPAGQTLWAGASGFASFASLSSDAMKSVLPSTGAPSGGLLVPLRIADVDGTEFHYGSTPSGGKEVMVLQWTEYYYYASEGANTFQLQIWSNGDLVFGYSTLGGYSTPQGTDRLASAVIGVEGVGGTQGLRIDQSKVPSFENRAIVFKRKSP